MPLTPEYQSRTLYLRAEARRKKKRKGARTEPALGRVVGQHLDSPGELQQTVGTKPNQRTKVLHEDGVESVASLASRWNELHRGVPADLADYAEMLRSRRPSR